MNTKDRKIVRSVSCWVALLCFVLAVLWGGWFWLGVFLGIIIALASYLPE